MKPISKSGLRIPDPGLRIPVPGLRTPVPGPRSLLLALVLTVAALSSVRAQVPYPQPPPPSDTVFPLGGLMSGLNPNISADTELPRFGLNMLYNGSPGILPVGIDDPNAMFLPSGTYGIGYDPLFAEADFHLASNESGASAWDLASTLDNGSDSAFWGEVKGRPNSNGEYYIDPALGAFSNPIDPSDQSTYYLWGLDSNIKTGSEILDMDHSLGTNDSTMALGTYLPGVLSPKFYIDFVYRLDSRTYTGFTDTAYDLEVQVKWRDDSTVLPGAIQYSVDDGTSWRSGASLVKDPVTGDYEIPIRDTDYKSFVGNVKSPNQDVSSHPLENPNLLAFPITTLDPKLQSQAYAILRIEVTCKGEMLPTNNFNNCPTPCIQSPITVNLKGVDPKGIYIRGVRIRSIYADNLYRGLYDTHPIYKLLPDGSIDSAVVLCPSLEAMFDAMRAHVSSTDWKNALGFNIGNECGWTAWRAFAYLNEKFRAYSYAHGGLVKDFHTIVTGGQNLEFWRPIYEDQSNTNAPPPTLQNESIQTGGGYGWFNPDNALSPSDQLIGRPDHDFLPRWLWYSGGPTLTDTLISSGNTPGKYFTGNPDTVPVVFHIFAGDAIPSEIKNHASFFEGGLTITGWNDTTARYGATPVTATHSGDSVMDTDNYTTYTERMQMELRGVDINSKTAAEDCYQQSVPASQWTTFYGYPSTFASVVPSGLWSWVLIGMRQAIIDSLKNGGLYNGKLPASFTFAQLDSFAARHPPQPWVTGKQYNIGDVVIDTSCSCYHYWVCSPQREVGMPQDGPVAPGTLPPPNDSGEPRPIPGNYDPCSCTVYDTAVYYWQPILPSLTDYFRYMLEPESPPEIRAETWDELTWGAKGIIYNPIGDPSGGANIGLCGENWEDSANSGFSELTGGEGDHVAAPPGGIAPYWISTQSYSIGSWVTNPSNGSLWVCISPVLQNSGISLSNAQYWAPESAGSTYSEYQEATFQPPDGIIPFATRLNSDSTCTWQDRYVISMPNDTTVKTKAWVPWKSDIDVYNSSTHDTVIRTGDLLDSANLNAYIIAVQYAAGNGPKTYRPKSGEIPSADFEAEYDTDPGPWYRSEYWAGRCNDPKSYDSIPGISTWTAFDHRLSPHVAGDWWYDGAYDGPGTNMSYDIMSVPTYYGMMDRSSAVKRVDADIAPIAQELKNLAWITAYDYADAKTTTSAWYAWASGKDTDGFHVSGDPELPLMIDTSFLVNQRYDPTTKTFSNNSLPFTKSTSKDDTTAMYYNIGVFRDPNDSGAVYMTIANRRTWPIIYNAAHTAVVTHDSTTSTSYPYLGAIDARIVDLKLKPSWFDYTGKPVNWNNSEYFTITNVRTGESSIGKVLTGELATGKDYELELDPGEGTLLRIAPSTSVEVGRTPYAGIAYNNGHRMCDISSPCEPHDHGVVWENNGRIMFCRVQNEDGSPGAIATFLDSSGIYRVDTVYDPHGNHELDGHNPSIASKGQQVAIVYSIDDFADGNQKTRRVQCAISDTTSEYKTWTKVGTNGYVADSIPYGTPLVKDITGNVPNTTTSYDLLTPVITPSIDGYIVAWTEAGVGIQAALIKTSTMTVYPLANAPTIAPPKQYRMVSLASRPELHLGGELIDMAWERDNDDSTSDILYAPFTHISGSTAWSNYDFNIISLVSQDCINHHPMIAVKPPADTNHFGMPAIVWESAGRSVLREMTAWGIPTAPMAWSSRQSFMPLPYGAWVNNNLPLPQIRIENAVCPANYSGPLFKELIYQDTIHQAERIDRYRYDASSGKDKWLPETKLKEYAQQGSVSMPYGTQLQPDLDGAQDSGVLSYRGIWEDDSGEYAVNIVTSPPAEMQIPTTPIPLFSVNVNSIYAGCSAPIKIGIGLPTTTTGSPPTEKTDTIGWTGNLTGNFVETPLTGTEDVLTQSWWPGTQDTVRTSYFAATAPQNLDMNRLMAVDTTELDSLLPTASHWISYKLVVKDSASGSIMQTLDSALVTGPTSHGFVNEPGVDPNDTTIMGQGYRLWNTIAPTPSGSAYITVIITKDSTTNGMLDEEEMFCDGLALPIPSYDTSAPDSASFKRSQPQPQALGSPLPELDVTVHPNPVSNKVKICVADLAPGIPAVVDVVNEMGNEVATLYDAIPDAELGLCLSLDCSQLASGIYYADLQANGSHKAVQFSVEH